MFGRRQFGLVLAGMAALSPVAAGAEGTWDDADAKRYRACLAIVAETPEDGFESAMAWRDHGGAFPARHCLALALVALGSHEQAALRLQHLAQDMHRHRPALQAEILGQAGNAWLLAERPADARTAFTAALSRAPQHIDLLIDRARAHAALGAYADAFNDLDVAVALAPERMDAVVFRAAARRHLGDLVRALEDVELALALAPHLTEALIERGILRQLAGDRDGARADWLKVLETAPSTPAADAARRHLEALDVRRE